jgi:hypothetical protein
MPRPYWFRCGQGGTVDRDRIEREPADRRIDGSAADEPTVKSRRSENDS